MTNNNNTTSIIITPSWLSGFIDGDGSFSIAILPNPIITVGFQVQLVFTLTQHFRDLELLKNIAIFLGGGTTYHQVKTNVTHLRVRNINIIGDTLLPLLEKYPLHTKKQHDLADFKRVYNMMKNNEHITLAGLAQIRLIKAGMNRGRKRDI